MLKAEADWSDNAKSVYDFFKLEQVGLYRHNYPSVQELAELLYLLCFEIFDENKVGVVLEANQWGNELQKTMLEMYNGRNNYSDHVFYRYMHSQNALNPQPGIKLRENKTLFVKEYQTRVKMGDIVIHDHDTMREMTTFIKKESSSGHIKFEANAGNHDDIVMTIVESSTVFGNTKFQDLVNDYIDAMPDELRERIHKKLGESAFSNTVDYSIIRSAAAPAQKNWWDTDL